jgi:hypothetical protein
MLCVGHGSCIQSDDHGESQMVPGLHVTLHRADLAPPATAVRNRHLGDILSGMRAICDGTTSRGWFPKVSLRKRWYT